MAVDRTTRPRVGAMKRRATQDLCWVPELLVARQQRGDRGAEEGLRNPDSNAARAVASAWMLALANDRRAAKLSQLIEDTRGEQAANDLRRPASDARPRA